MIRVKALAGQASRWNISVDGKELYGICPNEYVSIRVVPGPHAVGVHWWGGWWPGWHEKTEAVSADERRTYYFVVKPSFAGADMNALDDEAGRQQLAGRRRLP